MAEWWRSAVFYEIYPRSFADADGDGVGDLAGVTAHLDHLATLGVDALWLGPCFASPQVDHGYDVRDYRAIDPLFGTLADMDALIAGAHERGIRVMLDFVPNHTSEAHPWFREAVAAGRGSPQRDRYLFRDGRGPFGADLPNNWRSVFGGPSWTRVPEPDGSPGQWYYHLFAPEQPDLNWRNPVVRAEFADVLRFWLDRGVDGFRIDVADALMKDPSWADSATGHPIIPKDEASGVHDVYREFRRVLDAYPGDRMAVVETGAPDDVIALFLRPDEMHLAFNFRFVHAGFDAQQLREAIDSSLAANAAVGAPTTWVTDNHDTPRSVTRLARDARLSGAYVPATASGLDQRPDLSLGTRRARALALVLLALPGAAYLYSGQELGLPNVDDLPEEVLQDPVWTRSGHTVRGRDGCRVPLPWTADPPTFGFTRAGATPWLPIPRSWGPLSVAAQQPSADSVLTLYRQALALRRTSAALGRGELRWPHAHATPADGFTFDMVGADERVRIVLNLSGAVHDLPAGGVLLASQPLTARQLPPDAAAWVRVARPHDPR